MANATVFVAGAASLDVVARRLSDALAGEGNVAMEVGGTAAHVAMFLAEYGLGVRFMTALNESIFSMLVLKHLTDRGVDTYTVRVPELATALTAIFREPGVDVAISNAPISIVQLPADVAREMMAGCQVALIDANISIESMRTLADIAAALGVPLYAVGATPEKAANLVNISAQLAGVILTGAEADVAGALQWDALERSISANGDTHTTRRPDILISLGRGDVASIMNGDCIYHPVTSAISATMNAAVGSEGTHCSREALAAGYAYHREICGVTPQAAVGAAMQSATKALAAKATTGLETIESLVTGIANRDHLTGALNRAGTMSALKHCADDLAMGVIEHASLLMLDIDLFKSINDTYGHGAGDQVICAVAKLVRQALRDSDTIGRWGGEEFLVILPNANLDVAAQVAERIRASIELAAGGSVPCAVTASLGVAEVSAGEAMDSAIARSDSLLYEAKRNGRNQVASSE